MIKLTITLVSASLCVSAFAAENAEKTVTLDKIPAAAAKSLREHASGAKITNLSEEKDEGKMVYEARFSAKGHIHEITVDANGKLISDEQVIAVAESPDPVRAAIGKEAAGGKVDKLEHITEGGKVFYEALISTKGKREEVKFGRDGKVLARENKTGSKGNE
jgi:uncharacterized membrane protein YkoI